MRRFHVVLPLVVLQSVTLLAQTENQRDKFELFGGYSFERINPGCGQNYRCGNGSATNLNGWTASGTGYIYKSLGISAQFTGGYNGSAPLSYSTVNRYTYQFGPAYAFRRQRKTVFAHALFGGLRQAGSPDQALTYNAFIWSVGGGLDFNKSSGLSFRPLQIDYERQGLPTAAIGGPPTPPLGVNGLRYSAGIVLKF